MTAAAARRVFKQECGVSYSFNVRGVSKSDAAEQVVSKLIEVSRKQTAHSKDLEAAAVVATAFINALHDDAGHDVVVVVSGSVWNTSKGLRQTSVSVDAQLVDKL
jgi:hypothetical protein